MKLDRRSVLAGTAATFAAPFVMGTVARADAKRQSLVDQCLQSAQKVLSGKDFPDALKNMATGEQETLTRDELAARLAVARN